MRWAPLRQGLRALARLGPAARGAVVRVGIEGTAADGKGNPRTTIPTEAEPCAACLAVLPGATHLGPMEVPKRSAAEVPAFLRPPPARYADKGGFPLAVMVVSPRVSTTVKSEVA